MSAVEKLNEKVGKNLARNLGITEAVKEPKSPRSFGNPLIDLLLGKVIDVILGLLDSCLVNKSTEAVAENAMEPGILQRYVVRKAVKKSDIEKDHRKVAEATILDTMTGNSSDEVVALVDEVKNGVPDWKAW